jgi:F-type H+-transporting ATPase subunit c
VAIGVAFIIAGAAYGIAKIATASVEGMARQPEVSGNIQMALIITTAMIEGVAFFALIICLLELFK